MHRCMQPYGGRRTCALTFDQPSDQFGSFGNVEVTAVGVELDRKLTALLFELGVRVPDALLMTG